MSDQGYGPGGGGYGDPQYPSDPHGNQYGTGGHYAAPSGDSGQRGIFIALGAVVVAGLVVLILAVTGVFSGSGSGGSGDSPKQVVEKVLFASKKQNLDDVKAVVCKKDLADPDLSDIVGKDHATSYSIGSVTEESDERAVVDVRVTTSDNDTDSAKLAVVKEDGSWKVCFSETGGSTGSNSSSYTPPPTTSEVPTPTTSSTTGSSVSFCGSQSSAAETAKTFISFITLSSTTLADDCVYQGRVSSSQLEALTGDVYSPTQNDGQPGPRFVYKSAQGTSTITLTVEKESDGKYYVTAASKS